MRFGQPRNGSHLSLCISAIERIPERSQVPCPAQSLEAAVVPTLGRGADVKTPSSVPLRSLLQFLLPGSCLGFCG